MECKSKSYFDKLLSHRLKGFSDRDNCTSGLKDAMAAKVCHIEIDVRVTKDNYFIVTHDPYFVSVTNEYINIAKNDLVELKNKVDYKFNTLDDFLVRYIDAIKVNPSCILHIDLKFSGMEKEVYTIISKHLEVGDYFIVSWIPEVILSFFEINNKIPLCLSHIPAKERRISYWISRLFINQKSFKITLLIFGRLRAKWVYELKAMEMRYSQFFQRDRVSKDLNIACIFRSYPTEELISALKTSGGYVCIPKKYATINISNYFQNQGIKVAAFAFNNAVEIESEGYDSYLDYLFCDFSEIFN